MREEKHDQATQRRETHGKHHGFCGQTHRHHHRLQKKTDYREKHERKPAREKELSMAKEETDEKDISDKRKGRETNTSFRTAYSPSWHGPDIPTALPKLPHTPFFLFTDHKSSCTGKEKALTTGALL